jgi:hypothetical protein
MEWTEASSIITSMATVVLVFITAIYVYLTNRILKSSDKATQENFRPHVLASLVSKNSALHIIFENYGNRPALNAIANFTPNIDERLFHEKLKEATKLFSQSIIMPGQSLESAIGFNKDNLHREDFDSICFKYKVKVTYEDVEGKFYDIMYPINIQDYYFQGKTGYYEQKYYVKGIYEELSEIRKIIENKI